MLRESQGRWELFIIWKNKEASINGLLAGNLCSAHFTPTYILFEHTHTHAYDIFLPFKKILTLQ